MSESEIHFDHAPDKDQLGTALGYGWVSIPEGTCVMVGRFSAT